MEISIEKVQLKSIRSGLNTLISTPDTEEFEISTNLFFVIKLKKKISVRYKLNVKDPLNLTT